MNVSVVVATFGSSEWAHRGLEALKALEGHPGVVEKIRVHDPVLDGLAQARNSAARTATGDWLCFVDADDTVEHGYFGAMAASFDALPKTREAGELMGRHIPAARYDWLLVPSVAYVDRRGGLMADFATLDRAVVPSWRRSLIDLNCAVIGTLVPRLLFLEVGGFRSRLEDGTRLDSLEDWDLFLRCVRAGAKMVAVPDAVYVAQRGHRRNADQSPYEAIRRELGPGFDWADIDAYKVEASGKPASGRR